MVRACVLTIFVTMFDLLGSKRKHAFPRFLCVPADRTFPDIDKIPVFFQLGSSNVHSEYSATCLPVGVFTSLDLMPHP